MSRSYSPDEMATPRDPSREPRESKPGPHRDEEGQDQGRSGGTENQPRPSRPQEVRKPEARTVEPPEPKEKPNPTYPPPHPENHTYNRLLKFPPLDPKDFK